MKRYLPRRRNAIAQGNQVAGKPFYRFYNDHNLMVTCGGAILIGNNLHYKLSDEVLIALLITSTANVIGMMLIILKNLFPNRDSK
ncbi:hypothetical protein [Flavimarina sp. Hel_I_48]|uniref:hypothetical protein n=1 Tax=Flavimarina sp. Hel_I_48 TaxID=1392488 RepID=UPI0013D9EEAE|nr:hypothetical protein [Flavimarina sp. Hel_I_48]